MKKLLLFTLLNAVMFASFSQRKPSYREQVRDNERKDRKAEQEAEDNKYSVTVGTSKNTASYGTTDGFRIKDYDIRIVGFLHRGNRIEYKEVYIETKRDSVVIDSQIVSCTGIHVKWRDFYLNLSNVVYGNSYLVTVYANENRTVVLGSKYFFIKHDYD